MGEYSSECQGWGVELKAFLGEIQQNRHFMGAIVQKHCKIDLKLGISLLNEPLFLEEYSPLLLRPLSPRAAGPSLHDSQ